MGEKRGKMGETGEDGEMGYFDMFSNAWKWLAYRM